MKYLIVNKGTDRYKIEQVFGSEELARSEINWASPGDLNNPNTVFDDTTDFIIELEDDFDFDVMFREAIPYVITTSQEKSGLVTDFTVDYDYTTYRQTKKTQINENTQRLIYKGYVYAGTLTKVIDSTQHQNVVFPMKQHNQDNWDALARKVDKGDITTDWKSNDIEGCSYIIPNGDLTAFLDGIFDFITGTRSSGQDLIDQINSATTLAEIKAVVDSRS